MLRNIVFTLGVLNASLSYAESIETVFDNAALYTVKIETTTRHPYVNDTHGTITGAGFLINKAKGWVLTNRHVVAEAPSSVNVRFKGGDYFAAEKFYLDPQLDLALVRIPVESIPQHTTEAKLGCNEKPEMGNPVVVFGHPAGLNFTGTRGIISGTTFVSGNESLQTDAPLNSGNSGGPLISLKSGKVVGVSQAKINRNDTEGLNLTVSIEHVCKIVSLIEAGKDPSPPSFPIVFISHDADKPRLVVARSYYPDKSLLKFGDIIKRVKGSDEKITNIDHLKYQLRGVDEPAELVIERNGQEMIVTLPFTPQPKMLKQTGLALSGMTLSNFNPIDRGEGGYEDAVYVAHVAEGSEAYNAWFEDSDLIYSIQGTRVFSTDDVFQVLKSFNNTEKEIKVLVRVYSSDPHTVFKYHELTLAVNDLQVLKH